jgi:hypothetical protein
MKIRPVGAELFHADRRTDTTKLIVAFRNFANAPKKNSVDSQTRIGNLRQTQGRQGNIIFRANLVL